MTVEGRAAWSAEPSWPDDFRLSSWLQTAMQRHQVGLAPSACGQHGRHADTLKYFGWGGNRERHAVELPRRLASHCV